MPTENDRIRLFTETGSLCQADERQKKVMVKRSITRSGSDAVPTVKHAGVSCPTLAVMVSVCVFSCVTLLSFCVHFLSSEFVFVTSSAVVLRVYFAISRLI